LRFFYTGVAMKKLAHDALEILWPLTPIFDSL